MNDLQSIIDRQLGINCRFNYDTILRRLVVRPEESFYGLQNTTAGAVFELDPPIFACRFAEAEGYEHLLALANEDGRVALQDTSKVVANTVLEGFQCHNNAVFDLAWMPRHMSFVTVSGDHTAALWDIREGAPQRVLVFSSHTKSVKTAVFRPQAPSVFATGARDGNILVWDTRAGGAGAAAAAVLLRPDNCLAGGHAAPPARARTPGSHAKRARVEPPRAASITGLVFQDDDTLISAGECDGNIKVWDLRKNYSAHAREPLPRHAIPYCGSSAKHGYTNLLMDDARLRLYASCMDNVLYAFNVGAGGALPEQRYTGHENATFYIKACLSPDGRYLVSGSSDKHAYIWNVRYSQPVVRLAGHGAEVTCAAWCRRRRGDAALVTCSDDARHKIWRIGPEWLDEDEGRALQGRAEPAPPGAALPHWGAGDATPRSLRRTRTPTPNALAAKRPRADTARKTKRCLADMLSAAGAGGAGGAGGAAPGDDRDAQPKRLKLEAVPEADENLLPAGTKRRAADYASPTKRRPDDAADWSYAAPVPGSSFMTPTKNYERKLCKKITPKKSPRAAAVPASPGSAKVRAISFSPPTKDLPNFVLTGEAPHLRLMSPPKKKQDSTDWLTRLVRQRRDRAPPAAPPPAPLSPRENLAPPPRRPSACERTPKPAAKSRTLLKYFNVTVKDK